MSGQVDSAASHPLPGVQGTWDRCLPLRAHHACCAVVGPFMTSGGTVCSVQGTQVL